MFVTNSKYKTKSIDAPPSIVLGDIEYPSLTDIKMKPQPTEKPYDNYVPRIDRSSKPAFGQKSFEQQQPINSVTIVKKREMILDQVLQKEREALKIENELSSIVNATITQSETEQSEWYNKQTELEYELVQKENELNDTITELNAITTPELETTIQNDTVNVPEVKAIVARIEAKTNEHSENERQIKQNLQELEKKRKAAREQQKRHLEVSFFFHPFDSIY